MFSRQRHTQLSYKCLTDNDTHTTLIQMFNRQRHTQLSYKCLTDNDTHNSHTNV